jgi:hypothetical protein
MDWQYYSPEFEYEEGFNDLSSPWAAQKYFVYDLVRNLRPKQILIVGIVEQDSFFPFCQALKEGQFGGELTIIDIREKDKNSVPPDQSIQKIKELYYPDLNIKWLRASMEEALTNASDGAIDILLMDVNTLTSVRPNFYSWIDLIGKEGLLLIHGIKDTGNPGVAGFWETLKENYGTLELSHSHGLGLLFKNRHIFLELCHFQDFWQRYYSLKAENIILQNDLKKKDQEIGSLEKTVRQMEYDLEHYKPVIIDLMNKVDELDNIIKTIHDSTGWKILLRYYRAWDTLIPGNTAKKMILRQKMKNLFKMISRPFIENHRN